MPLIFSPLSEDVLEGPFESKPRRAFVMLHSGKTISAIEKKMDKVIFTSLKRLRHPVEKAVTPGGTKDYLEKIIQTIRGCGFGVAIFSEFTPAPTLANIFFEIGLCGLLGKPVILVKSAKAQMPSDFVRTEWLTYQGGDTTKLRKDFESSIKGITALAKYYEKLGDLAVEAKDADLELAFERYKQALLIAGSPTAKRKIKEFPQRLKGEQGSADLLRASKDRLSDSISEFIKLIH
jgi:hypothetical protein